MTIDKKEFARRVEHLRGVAREANRLHIIEAMKTLRDAVAREARTALDEGNIRKWNQARAKLDDAIVLLDPACRK